MRPSDYCNHGRLVKECDTCQQTERLNFIKQAKFDAQNQKFKLTRYTYIPKRVKNEHR